MEKKNENINVEMRYEEKKEINYEYLTTSEIFTIFTNYNIVN